MREQRRAAVGAPGERGQAQLRPAPVQRSENPARGFLERVARTAHGRVEIERLRGERAQVRELLAQRARLALERQDLAKRKPPPQRRRGAERGQDADDGGGSGHLSKSRCAFT